MGLVLMNEVHPEDGCLELLLRVAWYKCTNVSEVEGNNPVVGSSHGQRAQILNWDILNS